MKNILKLKTYQEIKDVINQREKFVLKSFIIYKKPVKVVLAKLSIGILSSKKFGNAVQRNYARRRIIACLNEVIDRIDCNFVYVFIPRNYLIKGDYQKVLQELKSFFKI